MNDCIRRPTASRSTRSQLRDRQYSHEGSEAKRYDANLQGTSARGDERAFAGTVSTAGAACGDRGRRALLMWRRSPTAACRARSPLWRPGDGGNALLIHLLPSNSCACSTRGDQSALVSMERCSVCWEIPRGRGHRGAKALGVRAEAITLRERGLQLRRRAARSCTRGAMSPREDGRGAWIERLRADSTLGATALRF